MRKPKPPNLVTVSVITTITIVFWVFFTVYSVLTAKPQPDIPESLLEPVNPSLNVNTLNQIESKRFYSQDDTINPLFVAEPTPNESVAPTETPAPEEETVPTASPEAEIGQQ